MPVTSWLSMFRFSITIGRLASSAAAKSSKWGQTAPSIAEGWLIQNRALASTRSGTASARCRCGRVGPPKSSARRHRRKPLILAFENVDDRLFVAGVAGGRIFRGQLVNSLARARGRVAEAEIAGRYRDDRRRPAQPSLEIGLVRGNSSCFCVQGSRCEGRYSASRRRAAPPSRHKRGRFPDSGMTSE